MSIRKKPAPRVQLKLAHRAVNDLRAIERYSVEQWGRRTADRYLDDFAAAFDRIELQPDILRLEREFSRNLYFYWVRKHVFVCDYDGRTVIVLAVLHINMDLTTRLQELEPRLLAEAELVRQRLRGEDEQQRRR